MYPILALLGFKPYSGFQIVAEWFYNPKLDVYARKKGTIGPDEPYFELSDRNGKILGVLDSRGNVTP